MFDWKVVRSVMLAMFLYWLFVIFVGGGLAAAVAVGTLGETKK